MWAITHIPSGELLTNFNGKVFYSESEARRFLRKLRRTLKIILSPYDGDAIATVDVGPLHPCKFSAKHKWLNRKSNFYVYRNNRFYYAMNRERVYGEDYNRVIDYIFKKHFFVGSRSLREATSLLEKANLYFVIHRVN